MHDWQHASFFVTALIFWHALLHKGARGRRGAAPAGARFEDGRAGASFKNGPAGARFKQGRAGARHGMALLYLFTTTIHTGVLGALLTFAPRPLYATLDRGLRDASALSLLEDQQLGGLIMWVPGSLVYVGAALWIAARWLRAMERRDAPFGPADTTSSTPPLASPRI